MLSSLRSGHTSSTTRLQHTTPRAQHTSSTTHLEHNNPRARHNKPRARHDTPRAQHTPLKRPHLTTHPLKRPNLLKRPRHIWSGFVSPPSPPQLSAAPPHRYIAPSAHRPGGEVGSERGCPQPTQPLQATTAPPPVGGGASIAQRARSNAHSPFRQRPQRSRERSCSDRFGFQGASRSQAQRFTR